MVNRSPESPAGTNRRRKRPTRLNVSCLSRSGPDSFPAKLPDGAGHP